MDIKELVKNKRVRVDYWETVYSKVLSKCHATIKKAARHNEHECLFEIPVVTFGLPKYNLNECGRYIITQLIKNELDVKLVGKRTLLISWEKHIPKTKIQSLDVLLGIAPKMEIAVTTKPKEKITVISELDQQYYVTSDSPMHTLQGNGSSVIPQTMLQPLYVEAKYPDAPRQLTSYPSVTNQHNNKQLQRVEQQRIRHEREYNDRVQKELQKQQQKEIEKQAKIEDKKKSKYQVQFI
jgi:NAD(P)H-dependent FMN reductase